MPDRPVPEGLDALAERIKDRLKVGQQAVTCYSSGYRADFFQPAFHDLDALLARCEKAERDASFYKTERDLYDGRCCEAERERGMLRARLEAIDQPNHVLVLSSNRWTTEHTLACRESGHMTECDVHKRVADWIDEVGRPDLPNGRYIINDGPLPDALAPQDKAAAA